MYPTLRQLPHTPHQVAARLHALFRDPPEQAAERLRAILAETLDMVETQYPQVDTAYARYGLNQQPHAYGHPGTA